MNLTTATPAEIDAEWAPLAAETHSIINALYAIKAAVRVVERVGNRASYQDRQLAAKANLIDGFYEQLVDAELAEAPYQNEWDARDGWTRAYLVVTNGQGHVHRTTSCSTCYPTTQFSWLTELSGADEQEIVDQAGERACTVCYASAPVELRLDRPTQLFSDDEKRKQVERAEREAKRAAKVAATIEVPDFKESYSSRTGKIFKSERALTNAIAHELSNLVWMGPNDKHEANVKACRDALAVRGIEYDYDKALANARKRFVREAGRPASY